MGWNANKVQKYFKNAQIPNQIRLVKRLSKSMRHSWLFLRNFQRILTHCATFVSQNDYFLFLLNIEYLRFFAPCSKMTVFRRQIFFCLEDAEQPQKMKQQGIGHDFVKEEVNRTFLRSQHDFSRPKKRADSSNPNLN